MKLTQIPFILLLLLCANFAYAQTCDCESNFEWVKKTFEENDAGFRYALEQKGTQAYEDHNKRTLAKVKAAKSLPDCTPILYEWLKFFRSGHISIQLKENSNSNATASQTSFDNWETLKVDVPKFEKYLEKKKQHDYEGIWVSEPYKVGIKKVKDDYIGFIIASGADTWKKDQVKLKISTKDGKTKSTFYMRDHSAVESDNVEMLGKNVLQLGNSTLKRVLPKLEDEKEMADYLKLVAAKKPYLESLNSQTLYIRIPSFRMENKKAIDSLLLANKDKLLQTENLILDIRSGTGGSDASFAEILPFIYTNPIRTVGVEFLSTKLNNQRMLDFANDPKYGLSEETMKWAKEAYGKLVEHPGEFVNLNENVVRVEKLDTVYAYPKNVGIIINNGNGSTDEQFLLAAKQSKKVKLFGTTTFGVLDISNMYFVASPCKEFELGYSLSRSRRIPDFTIDGKGIQPDYYLDNSIPKYKWVEFVSGVLNGK
ncbi:S41 family peptidase [Pontibacter actiniarum]|uniref:Peptidase S41 n=1 Tax=Pontibacter actiniarum TaxID=323450 RepID=A0A1X9YUJ8_9BACT|nr:S41 family peptidase [Pontibacter actiniarum]ARS36464.1 peptidase S41 [Pontibacter actiniarum]